MSIKEIDAYEAEIKFPEILRRVEGGEKFTITCRGKSIADVIPSHLNKKHRAQVAIKNIIRFQKYKASDDLLSELKHADRK